jgi:23S rRNA (pseudouridine1915-N3)-methyltransferase
MPRGYEVERVSVKKIPQQREAWIVLDEKGQSMTTTQFAALLKAEATFLIGGADGLPDELKRDARLVLRISSLTLPHALAQVVLLEQLYRAATILTGHPYHRA